MKKYEEKSRENNLLNLRRVLKDSVTGIELKQKGSCYYVGNVEYPMVNKQYAFGLFRTKVQKKLKEMAYEKEHNTPEFNDDDSGCFIPSEHHQDIKQEEAAARAKVLLAEAQERLDNPDLDFELLPEDKCNVMSPPDEFRNGPKEKWNALLKQLVHGNEAYHGCIRKAYA